MPPLIMAVDFHLLDELQGGYLLRRSSGGQVWNPAFDVTPSSLIRGIITQRGLIEQQGGSIDVKGFLKQQGLLDLPDNGAASKAACCHRRSDTHTLNMKAHLPGTTQAGAQLSGLHVSRGRERSQDGKQH